ncbi:tumor necrosis factor receptor superfamily member 5 isoform X2 [Clinocottus analis]|uniref:tumor necrosis factor receptor superfamily member 5 isoform X2 n=1 Tax=Clinocottus analis TaxID=304258 RepID=UPI0035C2250E
MKMHLLLLMTLSVMGFSMTAAQAACDPLTQYERNGECCKMCGPGTSMSSLGTCRDPQCTECEENEYQDKYTEENKCQRQPYCDPHKNFGVVVEKSKTTKSSCVCKAGFHCSSKACITCVPHTLCQPGYGARSEGNHSHNTVCQKCTGGTFSKENSWNGVCEKWTECTEGFHVEQSGTDVSDNICEKTSRSHTVLIVVFSVIGFLLVLICACRFLCKDYTTEKVKVCFESCHGDKKEPPKETKVLITNPTDPLEKESVAPDLSYQDEAGLRTPEENDDQLSKGMSDDLCFTENGNFVTEEHGKSLVLSRQESQTQTCTDENNSYRHYDPSM